MPNTALSGILIYRTDTFCIAALRLKLVKTKVPNGCDLHIYSLSGKRFVPQTSYDLDWPTNDLILAGQVRSQSYKLIILTAGWRRRKIGSCQENPELSMRGRFIT